MLTKYLGFKLVKDFRYLRNRKDIFALPRIYKKVKDKTEILNFDGLYNLILGKFAVTSHGLSNSYNIKK